jgi:hypothetical protein
MKDGHRRSRETMETPAKSRCGCSDGGQGRWPIPQEASQRQGQQIVCKLLVGCGYWLTSCLKSGMSQGLDQGMSQEFPS